MCAAMWTWLCFPHDIQIKTNYLETFLQKQGSEIPPGTRASCRITPLVQNAHKVSFVSLKQFWEQLKLWWRHTLQVHLQKPVAVLPSVCKVIYSKDSKWQRAVTSSSLRSSSPPKNVNQKFKSVWDLQRSQTDLKRRYLHLWHVADLLHLAQRLQWRFKV